MVTYFQPVGTRWCCSTSCLSTAGERKQKNSRGNIFLLLIKIIWKAKVFPLKFSLWQLLLRLSGVFALLEKGEEHSLSALSSFAHMLIVSLDHRYYLLQSWTQFFLQLRASREYECSFVFISAFIVPWVTKNSEHGFCAIVLLQFCGERVIVQLTVFTVAWHAVNKVTALTGSNQSESSLCVAALKFQPTKKSRSSRYWSLSFSILFLVVVLFLIVKPSGSHKYQSSPCTCMCSLKKTYKGKS